jgi:SNF2 family DNA or RNA helicase
MPRPMNLYKHQREAIKFLVDHPSAGLFHEMGTGKTRTAILAANQLCGQNIEQMLVLCPAAVRFAWGEELGKLMLEGLRFTFVSYKPDEQKFTILARVNNKPESAGQDPNMQVCMISYGLLQSDSHVRAISAWIDRAPTVMVCDESSFLKNRTAHRTKNAMKLAARADYRWLLTGTPVANSPLDLWAQAEVMSPVRQQGPLAGYSNYYHFLATYAIRGGYKMKEVVEFKNLDKLTERFKPYVSRIEKKDCLDLPPKSYTIREVPLKPATWKLYQELRKDALMTLGNGDVQVEPHAAVRVMRLCQLTSGHVGRNEGELNGHDYVTADISSEKLDWLKDEIVDGELSEGNVTVWCRWVRERQRLANLLTEKLITVYEIFGSQSQKNRDLGLKGFAESKRSVMIGQPHAGGFGLDFTSSSKVVYLSNDFSYSIRNQSEDRNHRIGQVNPVIYTDVLATGPEGQRTVDHRILQAVKAKEDVARWTCRQWRNALE